MKKFFTLSFLLLLNLIVLSAAEYKISNYNFDINGAGFKFLGKTKEYSILLNYPINKKTIFESEEGFQDYLENYKQSLLSSRAFESVEVEIQYEELPEESSDPINVILNFTIQDSHHLLVLPYPKYSSNDGFTLKLKAKDTNFLGSLNELSSDLKIQVSDEGISPGLDFSFDKPFKAGIFDLLWINDYGMTYTTGDSMPEWDAQTGLKMTLPLDNISYILELSQYFNNDFDYQPYNDNMYFREKAAFSAPIKIYKLENYTNVLYTPAIEFNYYWDFDGINIENDSITSPILSFSQTLSNEKIIWEDSFKSGYYLSLSNSYSYYFQRHDLSPYFAFDSKFYLNFKTSENRNWLERFGIYTRLQAFTYLYSAGNSYDYGKEIGEYLRGILDKSFFGNTKPSYTASSAILFSLDLPHHIFTTNFKHQLLNFKLQISPFIDAALVYNRETGNLFNIKEGYYCAGAEFLVFPLKWNSYTIRASIGWDLLGILKSESKLSGILKNKEIFIGIGMQY